MDDAPPSIHEDSIARHGPPVWYSTVCTVPGGRSSMRSLAMFVRGSCALSLAAVIACGGSAMSARMAMAAPGDTTAGTPSPPIAKPSDDVAEIRAELDAATARAVQIQDEIDALEADQRALDSRLTVTNERITEQRAAVAEAERIHAEAESRFRSHLIEVYKRGRFDPISVLLNADSLPELVARADALSRIADEDRLVVADLNVAAADARYQQGQLEELLAQDKALRAEQDTRHERLTALLAEQQTSIATLTAEEREALDRVRAAEAAAREQWEAASVPEGTEIEFATATVDTHPGVQYLVSAYMPRVYRSTGETYSAVCSWYGPGFHGRKTASGQVFNQNDLTCASRTLPFGTVLALTRGSRRVIVYVNDRGPFIAGRDLDLSKAAAEALGFSGVQSVQVEVVTAAE